MKDLNTRNFDYDFIRVDGGSPFPCEFCQTGYDSPWHLDVMWHGQRAMTICAEDARRITMLVDLCSDCITDPTAERVCDTCGKDYRRKKLPEVEVTEEKTADTPQEVVA